MNCTFASRSSVLVLLNDIVDMPTSRFEPSSIKNKVKREEIARKQKKAKRQDKLQRRLAQAKVEANDPLAKKVRLVSKNTLLLNLPYST